MNFTGRDIFVRRLVLYELEQSYNTSPVIHAKAVRMKLLKGYVFEVTFTAVH